MNLPTVFTNPENSASEKVHQRYAYSRNENVEEYYLPDLSIDSCSSKSPRRVTMVCPNTSQQCSMRNWISLATYKTKSP